MRILYLAHRIPYPPNKGDKIRSYHHVRYLAGHHELHLVSFVDEPQDEAGADALREYCASVELIRLEKRQALLGGLRTLATGRSLSEGYFGSTVLRGVVARLASQLRFDVAWAFSSVMIQYLANAGAARCVADFVDVDSEKWRQFGRDTSPPVGWLYAAEAARLQAFEDAASGAADCFLFVSAAEASLYRERCPAGTDVRVVPNGVDTAYFRPRATEPPDTSPTLLFTGALDYRPNADAVLFFVREVLPLVRNEAPGVRFIAVGHRPSAQLLREAEQHEGFAVAGSVPDVRPYFEQAHVYVAPLRLGRGLQNKVLEAMAMNVPVVATSLALSGLAAEPDVHALSADEPRALARCVLSLLRERERRQRLAAAALRLVRQRYEWSDNLRLLDGILDSGANQPSPARLASSAF